MDNRALAFRPCVDQHAHHLPPRRRRAALGAVLFGGGECLPFHRQEVGHVCLENSCQAVPHVYSGDMESSDQRIQPPDGARQRISGIDRRGSGDYRRVTPPLLILFGPLIFTVESRKGRRDMAVLCLHVHIVH